MFLETRKHNIVAHKCRIMMTYSNGLDPYETVQSLIWIQSAQ